MGIEYAENMTNHKTTNIGNQSARDYIKDWKKTKTDLLKCAGDFKKRAETLKEINPTLAAELENRSHRLTEAAASMTKPAKGKNHISTNQIRRAVALGRLALAKDKR